MTTLTVDRQQFAADRADHLAQGVGPRLMRRPPTRGWTSRCVWYESPEVLMAVIGPQEGRYVDLALAHGLHLARDRRLVLVLPKAWAGPTLHRLAWIGHQIEVYEFDEEDDRPRPARRPSKAMTRNRAGGPETKPAYHLGSSAEWVRGLVEWATRHPHLDGSHRRDTRAWSCLGQRVLALTGRKPVSIKAGVDAKSDAAKVTEVTSTLTEKQLVQIQQQVAQGIEDAMARKFGQFEEHHLQALLRRRPTVLGLEHPVLREVPAWRPVGGMSKHTARGFLDLVGLDGAGDITIVETKLAADDILVLQGLDYWIWATAPDNLQWLHRRLDADPKRADVRLLYAVGGKNGGKPLLSKYAKAQLDALDPEIHWRLALVNQWKDADLSVNLLQARTRPE